MSGPTLHQSHLQSKPLTFRNIYKVYLKNINIYIFIYMSDKTEEPVPKETQSPVPKEATPPVPKEATPPVPKEATPPVPKETQSPVMPRPTLKIPEIDDLKAADDTKDDANDATILYTPEAQLSTKKTPSPVNICKFDSIAKKVKDEVKPPSPPRRCGCSIQ